MKESKVTSVSPFSEHIKSIGLYKFQVKFENGDGGNLFRKEDDAKLKEGDTLKYTMNDKGSIQPQRDGSYGGSSGGYKKDDNVQKMIVKQSTLKCAVEFIIAKNGTSEDVTDLANKWFDYIMSGDSNKTPF